MLDFLVDVSAIAHRPFVFVLCFAAVLTLLGVLMPIWVPGVRRCMSFYWGVACLIVVLSADATAKRFWTVVRKDVDAVLAFDGNLMEEHAGEGVLTPQVREMLSMLRARKLETYRISAAVKNDNNTMQRITESAWPIRRERDSEHVFYLLDDVDEGVPGVVLERGMEVALVHCPASS